MRRSTMTSAEPRSWYPERLGLDGPCQLPQLGGGDVEVVVDERPVEQVPVVDVQLAAGHHHLNTLRFLQSATSTTSNEEVDISITNGQL